MKRSEIIYTSCSYIVSQRFHIKMRLVLVFIFILNICTVTFAAIGMSFNSVHPGNDSQRFTYFEYLFQSAKVQINWAHFNCTKHSAIQYHLHTSIKRFRLSWQMFWHQHKETISDWCELSERSVQACYLWCGLQHAMVYVSTIITIVCCQARFCYQNLNHFWNLYSVCSCDKSSVLSGSDYRFAAIRTTKQFPDCCPN